MWMAKMASTSKKVYVVVVKLSVALIRLFMRGRKAVSTMMWQAQYYHISCMKTIDLICIMIAVISCAFFACMCAVMFNGLVAALTATWAVISGVLIWDTAFPPKTKGDE